LYYRHSSHSIRQSLRNFGVHYRTGSTGSPGRWIPGSQGRWVTKCDPVPCLVCSSLSAPSCTAAAACGGFAAVGSAAGDIDRQRLVAGAQQQRRHSRGRSTALSSKCEQCQVYSRRRMLNTDLCNVEKASNSNTSIADCPAGFTYLASVKGCYSLVKENLEWGVAGLRCKSLHPKAHLVIINDAEEQRAVKTWMSNYTGMHIRFVLLFKSCILYRADGEICLRPSCTYI